MIDEVKLERARAELLVIEKRKSCSPSFPQYGEQKRAILARLSDEECRTIAMEQCCMSTWVHEQEQRAGALFEEADVRAVLGDRCAPVCAMRVHAYSYLGTGRPLKIQTLLLARLPQRTRSLW